MPAEAGVITIALVGNPNCGKTSLFNAASGGHERTGNYSGVTVSSVVGEMVFDGRKIRLVDLREPTLSVLSVRKRRMWHTNWKAAG